MLENIHFHVYVKVSLSVLRNYMLQVCIDFGEEYHLVGYWNKKWSFFLLYKQKDNCIYN